MEATMTGEQLKLIGMHQAADARYFVLSAAQGVALGLARDGKTITSDDVRTFMCANGWNEKDLAQALGNAAGSIFKGDSWECVGFSKSQRPSAHARVIRMWRLRNVA